MIEHLESLLNIQVLSMEKSLYTLDFYCGSNMKREVDKAISSINKTLYELAKKMRAKAQPVIAKKPFSSLLNSHNNKQKHELTTLTYSDRDYVTSSVLSASPLRESRTAINISSVALGDYDNPARTARVDNAPNGEALASDPETEDKTAEEEEADDDSYSAYSSTASRDSLSFRSNSPEIFSADSGQPISLIENMMSANEYIGNYWITGSTKSNISGELRHLQDEEVATIDDRSSQSVVVKDIDSTVTNDEEQMFFLGGDNNLLTLHSRTNDERKRERKDLSLLKPASSPMSPMSQPIIRNTTGKQAELNKIDDSELDDIIDSLYEIHVKKSMHSSSISYNSSMVDRTMDRTMDWTMDRKIDKIDRSLSPEMSMMSTSNPIDVDAGLGLAGSIIKPFEYSSSLSDAYELPM